MKCPTCKTHDQYSEIDLHTQGFNEDFYTCTICGAIWSVSHGATLMVRDPQEHSFLESLGDCVEADDYGVAA